MLHLYISFAIIPLDMIFFFVGNECKHEQVKNGKSELFSSHQKMRCGPLYLRLIQRLALFENPAALP